MFINGAPVNVKFKSGKTPPRLAVEQQMENYVINLLLVFGASFGVSCDRNRISLLERALNRCGASQEKERYEFKMLGKYYFLENPGFNIQSLIQGHWDHERLSVFAEECVHELQRMESKNVRSGCTLRKFICEYFLQTMAPDYQPEVAYYDFNQLLRILAYNEFPVYIDIIVSKVLASKIGKVLMKEQLQELTVYTVEYCPIMTCIVKTIVLDYLCVCELSLLDFYLMENCCV